MGENSTSYKNSAAGRYVCAVTLTPEPASPHQNWTRKEHVHSTIETFAALCKKNGFLAHFTHKKTALAGVKKKSFFK
jgi:hypothetical protein